MKSILPIPLSVLSGFLIALSAKLTVAKDCIESRDGIAKPTVDCSDAFLKDMPQTFSKIIQITKFTSLSFARYTEITAWNFNYSMIDQISEKTFLLPLKKLDRIAVSNLNDQKLPHFPQWILPPSIQTIFYHNNHFGTINFADQNLPLLSSLYLINAQLKSFPILGPMFSLLYLELSGNPDMEVTVEHLFPQCKLEKILFNPLSEQTTRLTKKWTSCHCLRLKRYLVENQIQNDFHGYPCGNAMNENCSFNFTGKYIPDEVRRVCLPPIFNQATSNTTNRPMVPEERNSWLMKVLGILFLLLLLIATISTILIYLRRNKEMNEFELESTEDMTWEENEENEEESSPNEY